MIDNGNIVNERRLRATKYYEKGHTHKSIDMSVYLYYFVPLLKLVKYSVMKSGNKLLILHFLSEI